MELKSSSINYPRQYEIFRAVKIHVAVYRLITPNSLLIGHQHVNRETTSQSSGTSALKIETHCSSEMLVAPHQAINTIIIIIHTQSHVHVCMCTLSVNYFTTNCLMMQLVILFNSIN